MNERSLHELLCWGEIGLGVVTLFALLFVVAPYGRHTRPGWGPTLPARLAWVLMELPAALGFLMVYLLGQHRLQTVPLVLAATWLAHYGYRAFVFPLRLSSASRPMPLLIVASGFSFNCLNAWINARWISHLGDYPDAWLTSAWMIFGLILFAAGLVANRFADRTLIAMRRRPGDGYGIPRGPLYRRISCPNYLAEIIQWIGWAVATRSLAGAAFAFYTFANLAPRARANHRWYREHFPDYPEERRALIPWLF